LAQVAGFAAMWAPGMRFARARGTTAWARQFNMALDRRLHVGAAAPMLGLSMKLPSVLGETQRSFVEQGWVAACPRSNTGIEMDVEETATEARKVDDDLALEDDSLAGVATWTFVIRGPTVIKLEMSHQWPWTCV